MNKSVRSLLALFLVVCMTLSLFTGAIAATEEEIATVAISAKTATLVTNPAALKAGDQIVIAAALSFICSMGDLMPPTALAGNYAAQIVGEKYSKVLRYCAIPFVVCVLFGLVTLLQSGNLGFLT